MPSLHAAAAAPASRAQDDESLPGWIYHDPEFFAAERDAVFRHAWQLVCHVSDVPHPGDFHTLDFLGESVLAVRGDDGQLRCFHNVCRHRGARLLDGARGHCGRRIACPYHRWTYALDGALVGVPRLNDYPGLEMRDHGLVPLEQETFMGFVFVRRSVLEACEGRSTSLAPGAFSSSARAPASTPE